MKTYRKMVLAISLMSVFAPAARADLVADPNEFKQLKKLTRGDKQNNNSKKKGQISPKVKDETKQTDEIKTEKVDVKFGTKADDKVKVKAKDKSKSKSVTTTTGEKSK